MWLGKLTTLDMTLEGRQGCKTSALTNNCIYFISPLICSDRQNKLLSGQVFWVTKFIKGHIAKTTKPAQKKQKKKQKKTKLNISEQVEVRCDQTALLAMALHT